VPDDDGSPAASPVTLSEPERRLLRELQRTPDELQDEEELVERLGVAAETVRGSLQRLRSKHLAVSDETSSSTPRLTRRGNELLTEGLPERRLLKILQTAGAVGVAPEELEAAGIGGEERSAAIGILRRRGLLADGTPFRLASVAHPPEQFPEERTLRDIADGSPEIDPASLAALQKRGLATVEKTTERRWGPSEEGRRMPVPLDDQPMIGAVTPQLLLSGAWQGAPFRPYDVRAPVPYVGGARPHPYLAWVREFEEILIGLGFVQAEGPLLETEFWNADVLNMPQEHPARSIHDVLGVRDVVGKPPADALLERVAAVHEGRTLPGESAPVGPGWRYPYDRAVAARPVLRSQTTAVSARFLAAHPTAPFRMYCLDRNFRKEELDATHHIEFGQCEGLLGEEGITLRHLVGMFRELAAAIGIRELKIRPSYFPFTEPSIEGYVRHPRLGWIEVFPGGMFRPEVLRPLGIDVPVAAWGIGITRLAMISLGISDIRELFEDDLDRLTGQGA
jgi:phenylalanyl-tRNA synthetase alpha chain